MQLLALPYETQYEPSPHNQTGLALPTTNGKVIKKPIRADGCNYSLKINHIYQILSGVDGYEKYLRKLPVKFSPFRAKATSFYNNN